MNTYIVEGFPMAATPDPGESDPVVSDPAESRLVAMGRRLLTQCAYLLAAFPLSVVAFSVIVSLLSVGIGTVVVWVGLPILVATVMLTTAYADLERWMAHRATGLDMPRPRYLRPSNEAGLVRRWLAPLSDAHRWLDVVWVVVNFVVSTITFTVAATWLAGAASTVLGPLAIILFPGSTGLGGLPLARWLGLDNPLTRVTLTVVLGVGFAVTLPWVITRLARLQATVSHALLCQRADFERRIDDLTESRSATREAELASLRRLERDLHDGPQQRLVRLQLDLARAERLAGTDPERAASLVADARVQAGETMQDLRRLSRGIAPPVLVDRGLCAALDELAARSTVPVSVDCERFSDPERTVPLSLVTTVYFVVAEALANVNKHSRANQVMVTVRRDGGLLIATIDDDGIGGASLAKGHGLAGLADRAQGVEGTLTLDSPTGGPTRLQVLIPCAS